MIINTQYNIGDKVYLKLVNLWGKIISLFIDCDGSIQYNCRYFVELKPQTCYFHEEELSSQEPEAVLGFTKSK